MQITAIAGGSTGSVTTFAEISAVHAHDIDSTPGNGAQSPAEDDEDTVVLTVTDKRYISGRIFEDTLYGGGNGQAFGGSGTVGLAGARIEVYDSTGNYIDAVTSSNDGTYDLPGLPSGNYFVRVVSDSVSSSRIGSDGSEIPVMTYRKRWPGYNK